jgi:PrgI family protein
MSQSMHGQYTTQAIHAVHTPRKHIVPTHLNVPDQVLTLWSFSLTARQLLLLLVGGGIGGTIWQHLALFGHFAVPGEILRLLLSLPLFLLTFFIAWYQYAGRYLEVWFVVIMRYRLRPKRYLWRSIRSYEQHLSPLVPGGDDRDREERASQHTRNTLVGGEAR